MDASHNEDIWADVTYYRPDIFPPLLQKKICGFVRGETDEDTHIKRIVWVWVWSQSRYVCHVPHISQGTPFFIAAPYYGPGVTNQANNYDAEHQHILISICMRSSLSSHGMDHDY